MDHVWIKTCPSLDYQKYMKGLRAPTKCTLELTGSRRRCPEMSLSINVCWAYYTHMPGLAFSCELFTHIAMKKIERAFSIESSCILPY